ncbi:DUF5333 domain-containing protein [Salipiger sp. P9]|uniref:DUF5333 domain-containing protein n=1 Tax=Salipiger pentaromativorans TaxID=2943193 RepID=UPI002157AA82|nr:DUF5333 domain-containing protein [Salipiger pentaromativorans]MCR8546258.1 DUF5333 domain-containing protein [Salipiger pentaromativorans]
MRKFKAVLLSALLALTALPAAATAKSSLGEVREIHDGLLAVGIADEIRNKCDSIGARMIRAYSFLGDLKARARSLGYSDDEIEDYVTSKAEKKKYRAEGEAWLRARGVTLGVAEGYCRVGREEIEKGTPIGVLLRAW